MFSIIRIIIGCAFLGCAIAVIRKSKAIRKRGLYVIFVCISVVLIEVLALFPFENLFITFDSPKDAYKYFNFNKSNIGLVVDGEGSDFLVDCKEDADQYLIIPKTEKGWKIGVGFDTKRRVQRISNGIIVNVFQYKNTSDFFVTILDSNGGESTISDGYNTKFYSLERNNTALGKKFVTYYGHISNLNPQYSVIVNGNKIISGTE